MEDVVCSIRYIWMEWRKETGVLCNKKNTINGKKKLYKIVR